MTQRKSFSGAAIKTTISSGAFNVGANTLSLTSATGWPTTVNGPFIATIDRGLATQEQISVGARSGLACSAITRGYAGTAEVAHAANATIEHGWDAIAADEANRIASLLTTKGDGLGHDGTQVQREPVGTAGYYQTATPAASTGRSWTAPPSSLVTAKGQVLAASASGVLVPTNTPTVNQPLIGDPTQTAGVRFGTAAEVVLAGVSALASTWIAVTFENGWTNYGSSYELCRYRKIGDIVYLQGLAKDGTVGTTIFTLPVGFRPPLNAQFATCSNGAFAQITVGFTGVVIHTVGSNLSCQIDFQFSVTP